MPETEHAPPEDWLSQASTEQGPLLSHRSVPASAGRAASHWAPAQMRGTAPRSAGERCRVKPGACLTTATQNITHLHKITSGRLPLQGLCHRWLDWPALMTMTQPCNSTVPESKTNIPFCLHCHNTVPASLQMIKHSSAQYSSGMSAFSLSLVNGRWK